MSSSLILKLSIVTQSGLSLAEIPRSDEETERQLAAGLLTALISFSKEVHKAELQSLNFHDRIVTFIPINEEFYLVAEMTSSADNDLLAKIVGGIKDRATDLLGKETQLTLSIPDAERIVDQLGSLDWISTTLESLGFKKPLHDGEIFHFYLSKNNGDYNLEVEDVSFQLISHSISNLIKKGINLSKKSFSMIQAFVPMSNPPCAVYLVAQPIETGIEVAAIKIDVSMSHTLFRLIPVLDREFNRISLTNHNLSIIQIFQQLRETHDYTERKYKKFDDSEISLNFLEKNVKKNLDRAIFSIIIGRRVAIVGDRPSVRIVTNSLAIFAQHRATDIVEWLDEDMIGHNITGMSSNKYDTLVKNKQIDESVTIIDLDKGRVTGGISNKFIKKLFDRVKKLDPKTAREIINQELELLVSYALNVTMLVMLSLEEAIENLGSLQDNINDKPKFDLIMELAVQRNPWLELLIDELSTSLKTAEDYLSDF